MVEWRCGIEGRSSCSKEVMSWKLEISIIMYVVESLVVIIWCIDEWYGWMDGEFGERRGGLFMMD